MQYKLVMAYNSRKLSESVNKHLREGWLLQGGIAHYGSPSRFAQAMVRNGEASQ